MLGLLGFYIWSLKNVFFFVLDYFFNGIFVFFMVLWMLDGGGNSGDGCLD